MGYSDFFEKNPEKFCFHRKTVYLCTRFPQEQEFGGISEKVLKNF